MRLRPKKSQKDLPSYKRRLAEADQQYTAFPGLPGRRVDLLGAALFKDWESRATCHTIRNSHSEWLDAKNVRERRRAVVKMYWEISRDWSAHITMEAVKHIVFSVILRH